ncbi:hypothetical protein [Deinococcus sp. QL22]|uniref:hypothetical protein n=1 Tax=Deinococcus sp. QL22 TaxID=2939437 RepID=UPI002016EA2D|nr:hypothetical protein [Deinococcus sp. QL22]UQN08764.1 hypothetical protein M1R55_21860 [Deinococcus sp. QL22]
MTELDEKRQQVFVSWERQRTKTSWDGSGGERHDRVVQKMREVLSSDSDFPSLQPAARTRLAAARTLARNTGLLSHALHAVNARKTLLLPWQGTQTHQTLRAIMTLLLARQSTPGAAENDTPFGLMLGLGAAEVMDLLRKLPSEDALREGLLEAARTQDEPTGPNKFDPPVPHELLAEAQIADVLNLPAATAVLQSAAASGAKLLG